MILAAGSASLFLSLTPQFIELGPPGSELAWDVSGWSVYYRMKGDFPAPPSPGDPVGVDNFRLQVFAADRSTHLSPEFSRNPDPAVAGVTAEQTEQTVMRESLEITIPPRDVIVFKVEHTLEWVLATVRLFGSVRNIYGGR